MSVRSASVSKKTRILGIDPGTRIMGYGILDVAWGENVALVDCGPLHLPGSLPARLEKIYRKIQELLGRYGPDVVAVERLFHGRNVQSLLRLGEARGVVLLSARMGGLEILEYTPAEVKKTVTGNGGADKSQVQSMMARILKLRELPDPTDVSDALAVAFCCAEQLWKAKRLGGAAKTKNKVTESP